LFDVLRIEKSTEAPAYRYYMGFPQRRFGFEPGSGDVGFVVDKTVLGQVFSDYFALPCQALHLHSSSSIIIRSWYNRSLVESAPFHHKGRKKIVAFCFKRFL
jgi:hypothetical protein